MKKRAKGRKFHRKRDQREAFMKSLAEALIRYERIETTDARARELRPYIERIISKSRSVTLHAQRELNRGLSKTAVHKLLQDLGPRFRNRPGGYTRITKRKHRTGDAAPVSVIEFVEKKS